MMKGCVRMFDVVKCSVVITYLVTCIAVKSVICDVVKSVCVCICVTPRPITRNEAVDKSGKPPPPGSNPPCAGSRRRGLLPGLLVIACYLSFTLLSQVSCTCCGFQLLPRMFTPLSRKGLMQPPRRLLLQLMFNHL